ncbi:MAG: MFS transporter [Solirubrobacterales bacterium]
MGGGSLSGRLASLKAGPLGQPPYRRIITVKTVFRFAAYMQMIASAWLVFQLSGSAMDVGIVAALALGPSLVGAPLGGSLADRFCPRKLSMLFMGLQVPPLLVLTALAAAGELTVPLIFAFVFLYAVPFSLAEPILELVVPHTVPPELGHQAVTDASAADNTAEFVGAVLGGAAVQVIGATAIYGFNAFACLAVVTVIALSPILQRACDLARAQRDASLAAGLREGLPIPVVRTVIYAGTLFFLLIAPIEQLMATIAADHGEGATLLGVLLSAIAVGATIGNRVLSKLDMRGRSSDELLVWGALIAAPPTILLGFSSNVYTDYALLIVIGFAWELLQVSGRTAMQLEVPPHISGRMVGIFYLLVTGASALGALVAGWLFDLLGVDTSLLAIGVLALMGALLLLGRHRRTSQEVTGSSDGGVEVGEI